MPDEKKLELAAPPRTVREVHPTNAAVILQEDERLEYAHERYANAPNRPRGSTIASTPQSFIDLVLRLDPRGTAPLYVTDGGEIDAVLNDYQADHANGAWRDWRICYRPTPSDSWKAWTTVNSKMLSQIDMAEFIQERLPDFEKPTGAEMLELAQTFEVNRTGRFVSRQRLADGQMEFTVEEANKPKATIKIPEKVKLVMRVFEGLDAYRFEAWFRWRVENDMLRFCFKLVNRDDVLRMAVKGITDTVAKGLKDHHVYQVQTLPTTVSALNPSHP